MSDVLIRQAEAWDLPAVIALWRQLQDINASFDMRLALNEGAADWFLGYLGDQLDNPNMAVLVAEREKIIVGYTFGQIMRRPTPRLGRLRLRRRRLRPGRLARAWHRASALRAPARLVLGERHFGH